MYSTDQHLRITEGREIDPIINSSRVSVVLIYASWCPFCVRFLPVFQKYAEGNGHYFLAQDDQEILAEQYDVEVIPTVLAFQNGTIIGRLDGKIGIGLNEAQLGDFVKRVLVAEPNF